MLAGVSLTVNPPTTGDVRADGAALVFAPATALQPNTTYTITLAAGLRSQQGHRLAAPVSWQFHTGQLEAIYSAVDATGVEQLYLIAVGSKPQTNGSGSAVPTQLTHEPTGIWDFAVAPDGNRIVYSMVEEDGTGGLWAVTPGVTTPQPLLDCPDGVCKGSAWSPDGRLLAYSRSNATAFSSGVVTPPRIWLLNPLTGENSPLPRSMDHESTSTLRQ
jgi:hypothetical protein